MIWHYWTIVIMFLPNGMYLSPVFVEMSADIVLQLNKISSLRSNKNSYLFILVLFCLKFVLFIYLCIWYERMSNCSQNCWIDWNSAALCFKRLFYIGLSKVWFQITAYHVFHWLTKTNGPPPKKKKKQQQQQQQLWPMTRNRRLFVWPVGQSLCNGK